MIDKKLFSIFILIIAAIIIRFIFFSGGIRGSDAYAYAQYSYEMASCQYDPGNVTDHFGFRYIVLATTALSYALFGVNDLSSSFFPFLFSIINIIIIFKIGEKLYDFKTSLIACILLTFYPLDILYASVVGPDSFTPLLSSLAILCYIIGIDNYQKTKNILFLIISGFVIGLSTGARETSIFLYGVLVLFQILRRQNLTPIFWITFGLGIPIITEMAFYYIFSGNAFLRIETLDQLKILIKNDYQESAGSLLYYPRMMFDFELQGLALYGLIWWLTVAGVLLAYFRKDSRSLLPGIWFILPFLGFEFGLQSFKEMILISKNYNYLALITPPAMLLSAYFLNNLFNIGYLAKRQTLFITALLVCLSAMNLYGVHRVCLNVKNDAAPYIAVANFLKDKPHSIIYTHHFRWPLFLSYFFRYDPSVDFKTIEQFGRDETEKTISGSYLIFHKRYLEADTAGRPFQQLPWYARYAENPPPQRWTKVFNFEGKPKYNSVNVYYAK